MRTADHDWRAIALLREEALGENWMDSTKSLPDPKGAAYRCWQCDAYVALSDAPTLTERNDEEATQHRESCLYRTPPVEANAHFLDDEVDGQMDEIFGDILEGMPMVCEICGDFHEGRCPNATEVGN